MLKNLIAAAGLTACLAPALAAQSASDVVATVGETEITLGQLIIARAQLPQQYDQFPPEVLFQGLLEQMVEQQLFADTVADRPDRVAYALQMEERSLLSGEAITRLSRERVTEEAIQEAYNARYDGAEPATEWNASHLLVETEEEAQAARDRVTAGEDFANVARDVSTGPSGPNGGSLGWFGAGAMVAPFEAAVMELEPGQMSPPVQTQFGWHIVYLNETRLQEQPGLEQLRDELAAEVQQAVIAAELEALRAATDIALPEDGAFDPAVINDLSLLEPGAE